MLFLNAYCERKIVAILYANFVDIVVERFEFWKICGGVLL
jgi:hypothetical protein